MVRSVAAPHRCLLTPTTLRPGLLDIEIQVKLRSRSVFCHDLFGKGVSFYFFLCDQLTWCQGPPEQSPGAGDQCPP